MDLIDSVKWAVDLKPGEIVLINETYFGIVAIYSHPPEAGSPLLRLECLNSEGAFHNVVLRTNMAVRVFKTA